MMIDYRPPQKIRPGRNLVFWIALAGTGHFTVSLFFWSLFAWNVSDARSPFWKAGTGAIPALALFALFIATLIMVFTGRKIATWLLVVALTLSAADFLHDAWTRNWQVHAENYYQTDPGHQKTFFYLTWWWYDEYWTYGIRHALK